MIAMHCNPYFGPACTSALEREKLYETSKRKRSISISAMITFICATVFAQMCQDWQWMPRPDMNFLSWGYGFFIISGIASIGAGVCFYLEAKKVGSAL